MILTTIPPVGDVIFCTWPEGPTRSVTVLSAHGTWVKVGWEDREDIVPYDWLHTAANDFEDHPE